LTADTLGDPDRRSWSRLARCAHPTVAGGSTRPCAPGPLTLRVAEAALSSDLARSPRRRHSHEIRDGGPAATGGARAWPRRGNCGPSSWRSKCDGRVILAGTGQATPARPSSARGRNFRSRELVAPQPPRLGRALTRRPPGGYVALRS